jgi:hypothetical protein
MKKQIAKAKTAPKAKGKTVKVVPVNRVEVRTAATNAILNEVRGKEVFELSISRKLKVSTGSVKGSFYVDFFNGKAFSIVPDAKTFDVFKQYVVNKRKWELVDTNVASVEQAIRNMRTGKYRKLCRDDW